MKAKEYAKEFRKNESLDAVAQIANMFLAEIGTLIDERHAKTNEALFSILDEQDRKWRAFSMEVSPLVHPGGFDTLIFELFPEIYLAWGLYKKATRILKAGGRLSFGQQLLTGFKSRPFERNG